ncbi:hypothetical protein AB1P65_17315 [Roseibium alexandrii]
MSEANEQTAEGKSLLLAIATLLVALIGLSSLFVVGYTNSIPREAILVFGRHLSLAIGLEAAFGAAFSLITAKLVLILIAVMGAIIGGILSGCKKETLKQAGEKIDDIAIKIATAPLQVVLFIAAGVFWARFLYFSFDAFIIVGGWILLGGFLFETSDRILRRKLIKVENGAAAAENEKYRSVRLLLLATLISVVSYSAGIAAERHAKRQETRTISEKLDRPGIVFGAGDIGLLIYVPGELIKNTAGGFLEHREPSSWYLLPYKGDPLELR